MLPGCERFSQCALERVPRVCFARWRAGTRISNGKTRPTRHPQAWYGVVMLLLAALSGGFSAAVEAQVNQPGGNQATNVAGIQIDAHGVVTPIFAKAKSHQLDKKRLQAAAARQLSTDVNSSSPMRKVSLVRLEAAFAPYAGQPDSVPEEMQYLAGLQRVDYVFAYPEQGDLVVAGPAEGFAADASGRTLGVTTGRPPVRLEDLIVALRASGAESRVGCSIDPAPHRLARMVQFINNNTNTTTPSRAAARFHRMAELLGMQSIRVWGVPANSHFAQALVEADYRMKLVSMELESAGVRGFRSHLSMLAPTGNSMQRWWFTPLYDVLYQSEDGNAFQFVGQRAQLSAQEEITSTAGQRSNAASTRISTQTYARHFTDKFPQLAAASPAFAELQNLIDLAVLGTLLQKERLPERVEWTMSLFLDRHRTKLPAFDPPRQVASVVNYRRTGRGMVMGLIGGGVVIDALETVNRVGFTRDPGKRLGGIRKIAVETAPPADESWWWD